jgi:hypothetical protein
MLNFVVPSLSQSLSIDVRLNVFLGYREIKEIIILVTISVCIIASMLLLSSSVGGCHHEHPSIVPDHQIIASIVTSGEAS